MDPLMDVAGLESQCLGILCFILLTERGSAVHLRMLLYASSRHSIDRNLEFDVYISSRKIEPIKLVVLPGNGGT